MRARLQILREHLLERYAVLSARERTLVVATLLAATWGLWQFSLGDRQSASNEALHVSVTQLENRLDNARTELHRLEQGTAEDPNDRLRRERDRLDGRLRQMDASLGTLLDRFVTPERMPTLLEDVMRRHPGLTLVRVESLPAEAMEVSGAASGGGAEATAEVPGMLIYRHPLRMEFQGGYFEVMNYLAQLEAGTWQFGWRRLDYRVADYPMATVTVEIETLSRERSWIGV